MERFLSCSRESSPITLGFLWLFVSLIHEVVFCLTSHVSPLFTRISNLILYQLVFKLKKSWDRLAKDKYICIVKIFILDIQGTNMNFFSFEKLLYYKLIHEAEVHLGNIKLIITYFLAEVY